ncbi:hypothetical protein LCGC14_2432470, partial [marine sediment metagenome]
RAPSASEPVVSSNLMNAKCHSTRIYLIMIAMILRWPAPVIAATTFVDDDACPSPGSGTELDPYCSIQTAINAGFDTDDVQVVAFDVFAGVECAEGHCLVCVVDTVQTQRMAVDARDIKIAIARIKLQAQVLIEPKFNRSFETETVKIRVIGKCRIGQPDRTAGDFDSLCRGGTKGECCGERQGWEMREIHNTAPIQD